MKRIVCTLLAVAIATAVSAPASAKIKPGAKPAAKAAAATEAPAATPAATAPAATAPAASTKPEKAEKPKIQMAILLDTSNSMDGLIGQARAQLWKIVNEFAKAKKGGVQPDLEVALYEYGNNGLDAKTHWIRMVSPFTDDLDKV